MSEFYDLAEQGLNHETADGCCWGNLGYWESARTYPEACTALADRLAMSVGLRSGDSVFDTGFGCGDQILHWYQRHGVRSVAGINLSRSQTAMARERIERAGHAAEVLVAGPAERMLGIAADLGVNDVTVVLALDCAYHFPSRAGFLRDAASLAGHDGRVGVTDLVVGTPAPHQRIALRLAARLARIPAANLIGLPEYQAQWASAGMVIERCDDITRFVFRPFSDWLARYRRQLPSAIEMSIDWTRFELTARFLRWCARHDVLRYVLTAARVESAR